MTSPHALGLFVVAAALLALVAPSTAGVECPTLTATLTGHNNKVRSVALDAGVIVRSGTATTTTTSSRRSPGTPTMSYLSPWTPGSLWAGLMTRPSRCGTASAMACEINQFFLVRESRRVCLVKHMCHGTSVSLRVSLFNALGLQQSYSRRYWCLCCRRRRRRRRRRRSCC